MAQVKLEFDDEKSSKALSSLMIKDLVHNEQEELAEEVFLEELSSQLAENPKAMAALTEQYMKTTKLSGQDLENIQLLPEPGLVVKSRITSSNNKLYQVNTKFFINICHSNKVPSPLPNATEAEIRKSMNGEEDSLYRVPTVISNIREDKDTKQEMCYVCDAIIHPLPCKRTREDFDFKLYIIELAVEMIEEQFNLELNRDFAFPNISYKGKREEKPVLIPKQQKSLITEISAKQSKQKIVEVNEKPTKNIKTPDQPKYTITEELRGKKVFLAIFIETPSMQSAKDSTLDLEPLRLIFNSPGKYNLDISLPSNVNIISARAKFIKSKKRLVIRAEKI
ncbi:pre-RNA processing PIH1/Nop17-domain-containing protein [Glomus cerebriforme]|uniref:PIH1 domain-containing protein 1 n=1 Tax=Glomus cerebriforme TaxID=658196 RepID=A0A397SMH1_9GLOM|nr:pre-RNA processing PIH1/Nop17-domain-containing protein [Glomus cerebriforme]